MTIVRIDGPHIFSGVDFTYILSQARVIVLPIYIFLKLFMRTIGIRVAPKAVTFVIYDSTDRVVVTAEVIKIPQALAMPEILKYVRSNLLDILREYKVTRAGIRRAEESSRKQNLTRIYIEGVIQETFASSTLESYFVGQIASISSKLGIRRQDFKKYIKGEINYEEVENWDSFSEHQKEAFFCAIGAIE